MRATCVVWESLAQPELGGRDWLPVPFVFTFYRNLRATRSGSERLVEKRFVHFTIQPRHGIATSRSAGGADGPLHSLTRSDSDFPSKV